MSQANLIGIISGVSNTAHRGPMFTNLDFYYDLKAFD